MTSIEKIVYNEIRNWANFDMMLFSLTEKINYYHYKISVGDYDNKKKHFKDLHYLKMQKKYINLKMYHCKIKSISSNERLISYLEKVLVDEGIKIYLELN